MTAAVQFRLYDLAAATLVAGVNDPHHPTSWSGIQYLEIGAGDPSWDGSPLPPAPTNQEAGLLAPFARIPIIGYDFLTGVRDSNGIWTTQSNPSRYLSLTFNLATGLASGTWRELALVGGNATAILSSGMYLSVVRIPKRIRSLTADPVIERVFLYL